MDLLQELQQIPGPSGDEGLIADFVQAYCEAIPGATVRRYSDLVLVSRGKPRVAVFAHLDTVGFTLAYGRSLVPIGGPQPEGDERVRECGGSGRARLKLKPGEGRPAWRLSGKDGEPGSQWVYEAPLVVKNDQVSGPYLDNRAGVWNALRVLERLQDVAVVFTPGEEHSGRGAAIGARLVYEEWQVTQALISDITWHTDWIKLGKGPAVSYRDRSIPRRRYLNRVLAASVESGIPFQHEVESSGGSDGSVIDRSAYPIDWVFVGAPQKRSHTAKEECRISDLRAMVDLYVYLVPALSRQ